MKKKISLIALVGVFAASTVYGSGYRIPEQSINSTALANAYVANTRGADTSYFNPANMNSLTSGWHTDTELMYIHLPEITFNGTNSAQNGDSSEEDFVMPVVHVVSPKVNNFRFGFSVVYPAGLSKRWDEPTQRASAEDFTLKTTEFNPTISYEICKNLSVAAGARIVYAEGEVRSQAGTARRDLEGDTTEYGYNVALSARPIDNLTIGATYRSKVLLEIEGPARLQLGAAFYDESFSASVNVPIPEVFTIGAAYSFNNTVFEIVYDKTYWSEYEYLDFNYDRPILGLLSGFDTPVSKLWSNTDAFRFGITHKCTDSLNVMLGFAIDDNPVPDATLGYELPDSDAKLYSFGVKYNLNDKLEIGAAYLFDDKEDRTVNTSIDGTFTDGGAHLFNVGANYSF